LLGELLGDGSFGGDGVQPSPEAFQPVNRLDREIGEDRAEKPEAGDNGHNGALAGEGSATKDQTLGHGNDYQQEKNNVGQPDANSEQSPTPMRSDAPESAVPESLREI